MVEWSRQGPDKSQQLVEINKHDDKYYLSVDDGFEGAGLLLSHDELVEIIRLLVSEAIVQPCEVNNRWDYQAY